MNLQVDRIVCTCYACPSQWEGTFTDGTEFYIRYRWGLLRMDLGGHVAQGGETVYEQRVGSAFDGLISLQKVASLIGLDLSSMKYSEEDW